MYGLYNLKCIFTYSTSWMICRSCHTSGIGQMICKYQSIKTDLGLAFSLCQDFSFFFFLGKEITLLLLLGIIMHWCSRTGRITPVISTGITAVISITLYFLVLLTMYQLLCNIKVPFLPSPKYDTGGTHN